MSERTNRVDELLRQELSSILTRDVADPGLGFVTITSVETAPDLRHAKVWASIIGQPGERDETLAALARVMPYARRLLGERLRIRRIPQLHVRLDDSTERGTRVLKLLSELEEGRSPDDVQQVTESLPTPRFGDAVEGDDDATPELDIPPPPGPSKRRPNRGRGPSTGGRAGAAPAHRRRTRKPAR